MSRILSKKLSPLAGALSLLVLAGSSSAAGSSGWAWDNPRPQGNDLLGVWGSGPNDVFGVGGEGTIVHFDGIVWTPLESGVFGPLEAVWCRPGTETVIVGDAGRIGADQG